MSKVKAPADSVSGEDPRPGSQPASPECPHVRMGRGAPGLSSHKVTDPSTRAQPPGPHHPQRPGVGRGSAQGSGGPAFSLAPRPCPSRFLRRTQPIRGFPDCPVSHGCRLHRELLPVYRQPPGLCT